MPRTSRLSWLVLALAVLVVTPASADSFLVYSQGGVPVASDLFTWCDTPPCDVSAPLSCETDPFLGVVGSPEGGNSLRMRTNIWGGWGVFPQQDVDLSAYENGEVRFFVKVPDSGVGGFDVKVEFQCNPDPTTFPGGITYGTSLSAQGWDGTAAWQEIVIPLTSYSTTSPGAPNPADLACLATIQSPFLGTIENLPFFNSFWVDYVRWHTPNSHPGPSSVQVQGRQLLVNGEPFVVNGVAYSPISIGDNWAGAWTDRPDRYLVDFPLIAASGANTVRLYAPLLSTPMLDAAWAEGLYVIPTFGVDPIALTCQAGKDFMLEQFRQEVLEWKDHPAILFWLIGNEVNTNLGAADLCSDWYPQVDSMALAAHTAEGPAFHPVATANADTGALGDICLSGCSDDTALPNLDLWAAQIYRGCSLASGFADYAAKSDCGRPLVITEFGVDSWDSLSGPTGALNETLQANCLAQQLADAEQALAVRAPGGVSSGQVIFEWTDEWWKAECDPSTSWTAQDTCASFNNFNYPDPEIQEEWWGIAGLESVDPDARNTRAAHDVMGESWILGAACDLAIDSHNPATGETTLSFDPAAGSMDHTLYYGPLSAVASYGYSGSVSGLGATGSSSVTLPPGPMFWVVAPGNNGAEGCYGTDSAGTERPCFPDSSSCSVTQAAVRSCQCSVP